MWSTHTPKMEMWAGLTEINDKTSKVVNLVKIAHAANNNKPADGTTSMAVSYAGSWLTPGTCHGQGARPDLKKYKRVDHEKTLLRH